VIQLSILLLVLALIAFVSVKARKLTPAAGVTGFIVAVIIFAGVGITGVLLLALFFGMGVAASKWKHKDKYQNTIQDTAEARRPGQVLANAGVAALMAMLSLAFPSQRYTFMLMLAGSLASATADTLSSELGIVYSKRFYNCLSFKTDAKGLDGVISIEGLLIGVAGAAVIGLATVYPAVIQLFSSLLIITVAGTIGNYSDSVLGATLERKGKLNNDAVNFLSTLIAALSVLLMMPLLPL
jgi:uncharacterized protein (TIGR00297 family)